MMMQPGDRIAGKYRIIRALGSGGMGVVFLAQHERLDRRVAIKVLHAQLGQSPGVITRFEREIKALAQVKSPYVAQALDADTLEDGSLYLVMEHLEGRDLRAETKLRGCIPPQEAVAYLIQACEGVAAAHDVGIVHRDLKPHNLFLTHLNEARQVKVLDFGVAKFLESADPSLTATDVAVGTPLYMSPEQLCRPDQVSTRSDVWALGVVLYEIIAGSSPFAANMPGAVIAAVTLEDPVDIRSIVPSVTDGLAEVIEDALVKSHEHRIPSVRELALRLKPFGMPSDAIFVPVAVPSQKPVLALERASFRPDISERIQAEVEAFDLKGGDPHERGTLVDALRQLPSLRKLSIPLTKPAVPVNRATGSAPTDVSIPIVISIEPPAPSVGPSRSFGSPLVGASGSTLESQRGTDHLATFSKRIALGSLLVLGFGVAMALGLVWRATRATAGPLAPVASSSAPSALSGSGAAPSPPVAPAASSAPMGAPEAAATAAASPPTERPVAKASAAGMRKRQSVASTVPVPVPVPAAPPIASDGKPLHL